jgi:hypothetical protein
VGFVHMSFIPGALLDPLSLNSAPEGSVHWWNCGGFALGIHEWYVPSSYRNYAHMNFEEDMTRDLFAALIEEFSREFPFLVPVADLPSDGTVIGFRLAYDERSFIDDFHFIVRIAGAWYEKPGDREIQPFLDDLFGTWDSSGITYDSPILWFLDTRG